MGDDRLYGEGGGDKLYGDAGEDTLIGGAATDTLDGGTGADTYVFRSGDGADTIQGDENDAEGTVNKLYFKDAAGIDDFTFSRDANNNVVIEVGADSVTADSVTILQSTYADGRYSIHYGDSDTALGRLAIGTTSDDPSLTGTDDADLLVGLRGIDTLYGGDGVDRLYGGDHDDTLTGGKGNDYLYGGKGKDTLEGGIGADLLDGGGGKSDTASYAGSKDELDDDVGVTVNLATGENSGDDAGGYTLDVDGNTIYKGDTLVGIENLVGSDHDDTLTGNDAVNIIDGGDGNDTLYGGDGIDTLDGEDGVDRLYGGNHVDTLMGGTGNDYLYGGRARTRSTAVQTATSSTAKGEATSSTATQGKTRSMAVLTTTFWKAARAQTPMCSEAAMAQTPSKAKRMTQKGWSTNCTSKMRWGSAISSFRATMLTMLSSRSSVLTL